jgi:hypothetical protein
LATRSLLLIFSLRSFRDDEKRGHINSRPLLRDHALQQAAGMLAELIVFASIIFLTKNKPPCAQPDPRDKS